MADREPEGRGPPANRTLLVGTYGAGSADDLLATLRWPTARMCDLVELRLDFLVEPAGHVAELVADLVAASPVPVIATCRPAREGGGWDGSEPARLDVLARAAAAGAAWIDVESDVPPADVPESSARVLRSSHVTRLPEDADERVARMLEDGDGAKLVALEADTADVARLLGLVSRHRGRLAAHVVSCPFTRVACCAVGGLFTYASLRPGGRIGPALPSVPELLRRAALHRVRWGTRVFALLGADVEGSVSPDMMNRAFEDLGADVLGARWSCDDPAVALAAVEEFGWAGAAVTTPHKLAAREWLAGRGASISGDCEDVGAVNTAIFRDGVWEAHNTDLAGLLDALSPRLPDDADGLRALILGAGGAARAAVAACRRLGARTSVFARRPESARALGPDVDVVVTAEDGLASRPTLVIDATPAGPPGGEPLLDLTRLDGPAVVLDMLVAPRPTALLESASAGGHACVEGFDMLLHQAVHQVRLLCGRSPDVRVLRRAGREALRASLPGVVLVGLRCSGKSSLGPRIAGELGLPFLDTDEMVAARWGETAEELISSGREEEFRDRERQVMAGLCERPDSVVALGGGAALHPRQLAEVARRFRVVHLDPGDDALLARWQEHPRSPLTDLSPREELARQRRERDEVHRALADRTVDPSAPSNLVLAAAQITALLF